MCSSSELGIEENLCLEISFAKIQGRVTCGIAHLRSRPSTAVDSTERRCSKRALRTGMLRQSQHWLRHRRQNFLLGTRCTRCGKLGLLEAGAGRLHPRWWQYLWHPRSLSRTVVWLDWSGPARNAKLSSWTGPDRDRVDDPRRFNSRGN